ncbi:MAG: hypothetical protein Q9166_005454 [cf. Caloplaca sp. 2 TL-2023]
MDFLDGIMYDRLPFSSKHFEDALRHTLEGVWLPRERRPWTSLGGFQAHQCTDHNWNAQRRSPRHYDWRHHDGHHDPLSQHCYRVFNEFQPPGEALPAYSRTGDPLHAAIDGTDFPPFEPLYDFERREPCWPSYPTVHQALPRYGQRCRQRNPYNPFDINFGFGQTSENDRRRRASGSSSGARPGYAVEEPDDNDNRDPLQLPHQARSRSRNSVHMEYNPEALNWEVITLAGTDSRSSPRSVSASDSSHQRPHTAAVPPSPHANPVSEDQPFFVAPQEDSPSSTPLRRPSTPRSPHHQGSSGDENARRQAFAGQTALGQFYFRLCRRVRKLKRKRDRLNRFQSELIRKAEELNLWEVRLQEREARFRHSSFQY